MAQADQNISKLEEKIALQEAQRQAQEEELKQLIQTYYVTERAKANGHLLNEGVEEDRISQYFQHLAKARAEVIDAITKTTQELAHNKNQLELEKDQIETLLKQQSEKRSSLASTQSKRKGTLSKIQKSIKDDKRYLAELQRNETRLKAEIAKAAKRNAVTDGRYCKTTWKTTVVVERSRTAQLRYQTNRAGKLERYGVVCQIRSASQSRLPRHRGIC